MGHLTVRFYGRLADRFGASLDVPIDERCRSVGDLRGVLDEGPDGVGLMSPSIRAVMNDEFVADDHPLSSGNEIEFFAPLSGG
jgi:molybdopterin converting factor small subunit